jgi:replication initiation protein RepC
MLNTMKAADAFLGLPGLLPGQVLAAFKAAAPFLGLRASVVHAIDWLFKFTLPLDWEAGGRPIVWPSAAEQRAVFGLSAAQVKCLNRQLAELGLVIMRDSPNGKRYGVRAHGRTGPIVEAYGFDLSPLATRMAEFQVIAAEGKARRNRMKALRRRASIARTGLRQILETGTVEPAVGFDHAAWQTRATLISRGLGDITDEGVLAMGVASLERMRDEACEALRQCFSGPSEGSNPVETDPKGSENQPHITSTSELLNPTDAVVGRGEGSSEPGRGIASNGGAPHARRNTAITREQGRADTRMRRPEVGSEGAVLKMMPDELIRLAPRLRLHLPHPTPTWPNIVEAADRLRET